MKSLLLSLTIYWITSEQLYGQNLTLNQLDTIPQEHSIAQVKFSGDDLYVLASGTIWKKPYQQAWVQISIDSLLKPIRSFDVNNHGQLIARGDSLSFFQRRIITTSDDFETFRIQADLDGSLNYVARDTIVLASGRCGDIALDRTKYSVDGGLSWVQTNFDACNFSSDYKRIGQTIHWFGPFGSKNGGPGSPITLYSHQQFSLDDFIGTQTVYSTNASSEDKFNYIINDNGSKYIHQSRFDRDTLFELESFYTNTLDGNLMQVGEGPFGTLRNGPLGYDVFLINNAFSNSKIYYKQNPQDDFTELTTNLDSIGQIRDVIYNQDKIYFITASKIFWANGIGLHNQKVSGYVYYDINSNCQYEPEIDILVENEIMNVTLDDETEFVTHVANGSYKYLVPLGEVKFSLPTVDAEVWSTCDSQPKVIVSEISSSTSFDIGLSPSKICNDIQLDVVTFNLTRCFNNQLILKAENRGTENVTDLSLKLALDEYLILNSIDRNYFDLGSNRFSISIGDLDKSQEVYVHVNVEVSCDVDLGEVHCVELSAETQNPCNDTKNLVSECIPNVGSFDPNDIQLFDDQGHPENSFNKDDYLYYKIRFQNTGTATAHHVRITNFISEQLDLSSFELLSTSHIGHLSLKEDRTLEIRYDNINLPDSISNLADSQGYFKYRIRPVTEIEPGTEIFNEANIYFDFNEPVLTNQSLAIIKTPSASEESIVSEELIMYPNPTRDFLYSDLLKNEVEVSVLDISGRLVFQSRVDNGRLDMRSLVAGCYLVKIHSEDNNFNVSIVKQ